MNTKWTSSDACEHLATKAIVPNGTPEEIARGTIVQNWLKKKAIYFLPQTTGPQWTYDLSNVIASLIKLLGRDREIATHFDPVSAQSEAWKHIDKFLREQLAEAKKLEGREK